MAFTSVCGLRTGDVLFIYDTYPYRVLEQYDHYPAIVTEVVYEPKKWWQFWKKKKQLGVKVMWK